MGHQRWSAADPRACARWCRWRALAGAVMARLERPMAFPPALGGRWPLRAAAGRGDRAGSAGCARAWLRSVPDAAGRWPRAGGAARRARPDAAHARRPRQWLRPRRGDTAAAPGTTRACAAPSRCACPGPFAARARRVAGSGVLLVGDAAGFLDPITGQGIVTALAQARAAARTIDRALTLPGPLDLSAYAVEHRRLSTTGTRLTWLALALCASPRFEDRAMRGLQTRPGLFEKLLAINCGRAGLRSLAPRDWAALLLGL